jgi:hypothetical protein
MFFYKFFYNSDVETDIPGTKPDCLFYKMILKGIEDGLIIEPGP